MGEYQAVFEILSRDVGAKNVFWQPKVRISRSCDLEKVVSKAEKERARLRVAGELHRGRVVVLLYPSKRVRF